MYNVIREFSDEYHHKCLGNKNVRTTSLGPTSLVGPSDITNSALELLAKSIFRMKEDGESTADVLSKQLSFQKEVEEKKKDKTEEWHEYTKNMILNCASEDGETPALCIPKSYLDIINCKSVGMAIQSIQAGMNQRGHKEVGWPEALGQSLHKGLLMYKSLDKPSGLTILCLYVSQPLNVTMSEKGLTIITRRSKISPRCQSTFRQTLTKC